MFLYPPLEYVLNCREFCDKYIYLHIENNCITQTLWVIPYNLCFVWENIFQ